jgi:hypothetical protein
VKVRWNRHTSFSFDFHPDKPRGLPFVGSRSAQVLHVFATMDNDFRDTVFRESVRESEKVISTEFGRIQDIHAAAFLCQSSP